MNKSYSSALLLFSLPAFSQNSLLRTKANTAADQIESKIIEWRPNFHEDLEFGNYET
jgi:hypothetical protein